MPSSLEWRLYYEENARSLLEIPWRLGPELTPDETATIAQSLKEFQAGESSGGKHLIRYAQEYAERTGDQDYVLTIRLFIAEEQRHARPVPGAQPHFSRPDHIHRPRVSQAAAFGRR